MNTNNELLVCVPHFPFPLRKNGLAVRYLPILQHASKTLAIHLLCITKDIVNEADTNEAKELCSRVSVYRSHTRQVSLSRKLIERARHLIPGAIPFSQFSYDDDAIGDFIQRETHGKVYQTALCVTPTYLHLIRQLVKASHYTLDFVDSPYSILQRSQGPGILSQYEQFIMKRWEINAIRAVHYASYISPLDRRLASDNLFPDQKVGVIPNGLNILDHTPDRIDFGATTIGFLGNMSYGPNIRAALRLYRILKRNQSHLNNVKLVIIGRDPAPELHELQLDPTCIVTGTVDNIWPYVNGVDIFVFPMETGSGQQNKVLAACAAGKPVICTQLGNSGIGAKDKEHVLIADTDNEIVQALISLLGASEQQQALGKAGQAFVYDNYSWPPILDIVSKKLLIDPAIDC